MDSKEQKNGPIVAETKSLRNVLLGGESLNTGDIRYRYSMDIEVNESVQKLISAQIGKSDKDPEVKPFQGHIIEAIRADGVANLIADLPMFNKGLAKVGEAEGVILVHVFELISFLQIQFDRINRASDANRPAILQSVTTLCEQQVTVLSDTAALLNDMKDSFVSIVNKAQADQHIIRMQEIMMDTSLITTSYAPGLLNPNAITNATSVLPRWSDAAIYGSNTLRQYLQANGGGVMHQRIAISPVLLPEVEALRVRLLTNIEAYAGLGLMLEVNKSSIFDINARLMSIPQLFKLLANTATDPNFRALRKLSISAAVMVLIYSSLTADDSTYEINFPKLIRGTPTNTPLLISQYRSRAALISKFFMSAAIAPISLEADTALNRLKFGFDWLKSKFPTESILTDQNVKNLDIAVKDAEGLLAKFTSNFIQNLNSSSVKLYDKLFDYCVVLPAFFFYENASDVARANRMWLFPEPAAGLLDRCNAHPFDDGFMFNGGDEYETNILGPMVYQTYIDRTSVEPLIALTRGVIIDIVNSVKATAAYINAISLITEFDVNNNNVPSVTFVFTDGDKWKIALSLSQATNEPSIMPIGINIKTPFYTDPLEHVTYGTQLGSSYRKQVSIEAMMAQLLEFNHRFRVMSCGIPGDEESVVYGELPIPLEVVAPSVSRAWANTIPEWIRLMKQMDYPRYRQKNYFQSLAALLGEATAANYNVIANMLTAEDITKLVNFKRSVANETISNYFIIESIQKNGVWTYQILSPTIGVVWGVPWVSWFLMNYQSYTGVQPTITYNAIDSRVFFETLINAVPADKKYAVSTPHFIQNSATDPTVTATTIRYHFILANRLPHASNTIPIHSYKTLGPGFIQHLRQDVFNIIRNNVLPLASNASSLVPPKMGTMTQLLNGIVHNVTHMDFDYFLNPKKMTMSKEYREGLGMSQAELVFKIRAIVSAVAESGIRLGMYSSWLYNSFRMAYCMGLVSYSSHVPILSQNPTWFDWFRTANDFLSIRKMHEHNHEMFIAVTIQEYSIATIREDYTYKDPNVLDFLETSHEGQEVVKSAIESISDKLNYEFFPSTRQLSRRASAKLSDTPLVTSDKVYNVSATESNETKQPEVDDGSGLTQPKGVLNANETKTSEQLIAQANANAKKLVKRALPPLGDDSKPVVIALADTDKEDTQ